MSNDPRELEYLLEKARKIHMTKEEIAEQRRSLAYGNAAIENSNITRQMIEEEDERIFISNGR